MLPAQEYLGTKPLHLWRQLHVVLLEGKERQETGELEVGMQWKDVLSESVLEERKSEQEKRKPLEGPPCSLSGGEKEEGRELWY